MITNDNLKLPKVLVCGINPWQRGSAVRTLPEIFSCWDKDKLAHIYTKAGLPDTDVCESFLQINENAVIKSVFKRQIKTARRVKNTTKATKQQQQQIDAENNRYKKTAQKHSWFMSICRELVWLLGKWKSAELDSFIDEENPDLLFMPVYPVVYMSRIQNYIIKKTGKPVVCYLSDDNFTYATCGKNPLAYFHRWWLRRGVKKLMNKCDKLFVIVPKQKQEYDRIFSTNSYILTRAVDFSTKSFTASQVQLPIKMVYTGKLIIGRDKALAQIARAVAKINEHELKITLDIYSTDCPDSASLSAYNMRGCCFLGSVSSDKIADIQAAADIVVFAESLDKKYRNTARLSFSTKLTDYLSSGKCIFALGDKDIAPIDYLINEDAAVVALSYEDIEEKLIELCENPQIILDYSRKAFDCAKKNHDAVMVYGGFKEQICKTAKTPN